MTALKASIVSKKALIFYGMKTKWSESRRSSNKNNTHVNGQAVSYQLAKILARLVLMTAKMQRCCFSAKEKKLPLPNSISRALKSLRKRPALDIYFTLFLLSLLFFAEEDTDAAVRRSHYSLRLFCTAFKFKHFSMFYFQLLL